MPGPTIIDVLTGGPPATGVREDREEGEHDGDHDSEHGVLLKSLTGPELTQEMIDEGMARVEKVACSPGDNRCSPFRWSLNEAR